MLTLRLTFDLPSVLLSESVDAAAAWVGATWDLDGDESDDDEDGDGEGELRLG